MGKVFSHVLCIFLGSIMIVCMIAGNDFNKESTIHAIDEVWSSWHAVDSPSSTFWGNIGSWTGDGSLYTGKGGGFPAIYSYSSLDSFGDASEAIVSMTNYRVRLRLVKPGSIDAYSKIIVGGKTSGVPGAGASPGSVRPMQIDVRSYGLDIDQFGNTTWNNGSRTVSWGVLIPGGITAGSSFTFEILVTPSLIEIFINGVSRYSVNPSGIRADAAVGLFALGGANTSAVKSVSFASIEYSTFGPPAPASATGPAAAISSSAANRISVSVSGLASGDLFQVWVRTASQGDGTSQAFSWILAKAFQDVSDVYLNDEGDSIFDYDVVGSYRTSDGRYDAYVRVRDDVGSILMQENLSVATICGSVGIDRILVEGEKVEGIYYLPSDNTSRVLSIRAIASGTLEEGDQIYYHFMRAGITAIGDTSTPADWFSLQNSDSNTYSLAVPDIGAVHNIRIRAYSLRNPEQNAQERTFQLVVDSADTPRAFITDPSIGNSPVMSAGDRFAINLDGKTGGNSTDPKYKFMVGEAWRKPLITQSCGSRSVFDELIAFPGIYLLQSYVSHKAMTTFDDGILLYTKVYRTGFGAITGSAAISSCGIRVNDVSLSDSDMLAYFSQSSTSSFPLSAGDVVSFYIEGGGLAGASVTADDYEFSFWRLDINGHREVKGWGNDGTLTWRPFAPGYYSIVARIKGSDAQSYEEQRNYRFVVSGISAMDSLELDIDRNSAVDDLTVDPAIAGQPVNITAMATGGSGNFVYRFDVWDAFLWTRALQGFSADNSVVWIPRKAGVYRIIVRAQDVSSCGFGDRVVTSGEFLVS